jgi:hypothetical protein
MIIRWGRKGIVAGAIAVTFISPVVIPPLTYIHEVQHRPSFKQEVRYVTPVSEVITSAESGGGDRTLYRLRELELLEDDRIIMEIITMFLKGR